MRAATLAARRSRVRGGLLLAMFAVVAVTVLLLIGMAGYLSGTSDAAVRQELSAGPPTATAVQLQARLAADRDAQADAVGRLIDEAFTDSDAAVHRTVVSNPVAATIGDTEVSLVLTADSDLPQWATVVDGAWPNLETSLDAEPAAVALQADAAAELGVVVGDRLTVEGRDLVVAATWLPVNATDPYWFGGSAAASGFNGLSLGPAVIVEGELAQLPIRSYARWTIVPGQEATTTAALPALAAALEVLAADVDKATGTENLELTGTLAERVATLQRGLGTAEGLVTVPLVLVGVIGLITLGQLARLLIAVRREETTLLRARGASVLQLTVLALVEAAPVTALGVSAGAALAIGFFRSGVAPIDAAAASEAAWPIALTAAGASVLVWGAVAWRAASTAVSAAGRGESGRSHTSATIGATVLVVAAAAVSLWQFKLYGSPLVAGQDGSLRVDPVTVVAPALILLALAMLGLLAFGPTLALVERVASRSRGILPVLPSRQVARRLSVFGVAVLLVTLSVGGVTIAAAYSQSWSVASLAAAQQRNGTDVRVRLSPPPVVEGPGSLVTTPSYLGLTGAADAATVLSTPVRIADDSVGLLAIAAQRMPGVVSTVGGIVPIEATAGLLAEQPLGVALETGATELALSVSAIAASAVTSGVLTGFAWLEDADGSLARISLGSSPLADALAGEQPLVGAIPRGRDDAWRVLAVEATLTGAEGVRGVEVTFTGLGDDYSIELSSTNPTDRVTTFSERASLPVVVSDALASRLNLREGGTVSLRIPSTASSVEASVVGAIPAIPGADGRFSMIADLSALNAYLLQASERIPQAAEVWMSIASSADAAAVAREAVLASHTSARVTTLGDGSNDRLVAPAIVALWWGMGGALLLSVIAVFAITTTFTRDRRGEVVVLRALGLSSSEQGRNRLIELLAVVASAVVLGSVTGVIASALTVGELASTAAGSVGAVALRFDLLGWAILVFATAAALVTISMGYAGNVARQARDTEYREETR